MNVEEEENVIMILEFVDVSKDILVWDVMS